jgi:hypothetical protein
LDKAPGIKKKKKTDKVPGEGVGSGQGNKKQEYAGIETPRGD